MNYHKIIQAGMQILIFLLFPVLLFGQTINLTLQKTIESPRTYYPGEEDKAGYWKDWGTTRAVDFYPESNLLAALIQESNGPARLYLYNLVSGQKINELIVSQNKRNNSSFGAVKFSHDGKWIAISTGDDKEFTVWDASSGSLANRQATDDKTTNLDWSPDGKMLAVVVGHDIEIWNLSPLQKVKRIKGGRTATEWAMVADWSPDGAYLAIGTNYPSIYIDKNGRQSPGLQPATKGAIYTAEWNADGNLLSSAGSGGNSNIAIWQNPKNAVDSPFEKKYDLLRTFDSEPGKWWNAVTWDPTGRIILAADNKSNIFFWNALSGQLLKSTNPYPTSYASKLCWKNNYLVTVGNYPDKSFKLWAVAVQ